MKFCLQQTRGFTVVELLIVISIITVLTGSLFATGRVLIRKSQRLSCRNNLSNIGMGVDYYCQDHGGLLPDLIPMRESRQSKQDALETVLLTYLTDPEAFKCPADNKLYRKTGSSYAWNHLINGLPREGLLFLGSENSTIIPLIGDKEAFHGDKDGTNFLYADLGTDDEVRFSSGGGALRHARK